LANDMPEIVYFRHCRHSEGAEYARFAVHSGLVKRSYKLYDRSVALLHLF